MLLLLAHGVGVLVALGGWSELSSPWPLYLYDHPQIFHSAVIARPLFQSTATNSGYDPSFMAGYAKSLYSNPSSNFSDIVVGVLGARNPVQSYRWYVFLAGIAAPWLIAGAGLLLRLGPGAIGVAVALFLIDIWSGFGLAYLSLGMVAFYLAVPLGLVTAVALINFIDRGGFQLWMLAAALSTLLVFVHVTSPMVVAPAAALAYVAAVLRARKEGAPGFPLSRHLGVWTLPLPVLAVNAVWWLPALWLAATRGRSDFAFVHPEPLWNRFRTMIVAESPIMVVLIAAIPAGLVVLAHGRKVAAVGLGAFVAAGFFWGYLTGPFRVFDTLQPGRHTFSFYTGAALLAGVVAGEVGQRLRRVCPDRLDLWIYLAVLLIGARMTGPILNYGLHDKIAGRTPFLHNRGVPALRWVVENVKRHVPRGERLLYEEGGGYLDVSQDYFKSGRFSGVLPYLTGVEIIGGPSLHLPLDTNFTQFGEGRLCGKLDWDRDQFVRYARLYRPTAIVCWSPHARSFCTQNADLVDVLEDNGVLMLGRVKGFEGAAIEGSAEVIAAPGRLVVKGLRPGADGSIVLKYHAVPCLRTVPPIPWDSILLEDDPVPFIRLRPPADTVSLEVHFPPVTNPAAR